MDILTYINKMNRLYGTEPVPVRYNTRQYLQGGRVGMKPGGLVEPGVTHYGKITKTELKELRNAGLEVPEIAKKFGVSVKTINNRLKEYDLLGTYKSDYLVGKPMSERKAAEIRKTLPDGVRLRWDKSTKHRAGGYWRVIGQIQKGKEFVFNQSFLNPTENQIKELAMNYETAYKKHYPNYLSNDEFEKLRFKKENVKLSDSKFAEVLNDLEYKTTKEKTFTKRHVAMYQRNLDIVDDVGVEIKSLSQNQQEILKSNFPEYEGKWDFKTYKYGLSPGDIGIDAYDVVRHTGEIRKSWQWAGSSKSRLWHNAYRAAVKGGDKGRFRILHPKDGEIMSRKEILDYNWSKGSKQVTFLDTQNVTDKSKWKKFNYDGFEKWMNNDAVPGKVDPNRFKNAIAQYDLSDELKNLKVGEEKFGTLLNQKFKGKKKMFSAFHNHHFFDVADNFWDTEVVFFKDNLSVSRFEKKARDALKIAATLPESERAKHLKPFADEFKKLGPIRMVEGPISLGQYDLSSVLRAAGSEAKVSSRIIESLIESGIGVGCKRGVVPKAQGGRIGMATADAGLVSCVTRHLNQTMKQAQKTGTLGNAAKARLLKSGRALMKWGVPLDIAIEGAFAYNNYLKGDTKQEAFEQTIFGLLTPQTNYESLTRDRLKKIGGKELGRYFADMDKLKRLNWAFQRIAMEEADPLGTPESIEEAKKAHETKVRGLDWRTIESTMPTSPYLPRKSETFTTPDGRTITSLGPDEPYPMEVLRTKRGSPLSEAKQRAEEVDQMRRFEDIMEKEYGENWRDKVGETMTYGRYKTVRPKIDISLVKKRAGLSDIYDPYTYEAYRDWYNQPGQDVYRFTDKDIEKIRNKDLTDLLAFHGGASKYNQGGRVPFSKGKLADIGRRKFMKWLASVTGAGVAAGTGLLKWGKIGGKGKVAIKAGDKIIQGTQGMPDWYIPLVNRITKEGTDVSKKLATKEREIVHTKSISKTEDVTVYQDLDTGNVRVEYGPLHPRASNDLSTVHLEYRAPQVIDEGSAMGKKTKPEFDAVESEPKHVAVGPDDAEVQWDLGNVVGNVDDLTTDTSKLKAFGTKRKLTHRDKVKAKKKQEYRQKLETDTETQVDYSTSKYGEGYETSDLFDDLGNYTGD